MSETGAEVRLESISHQFKNTGEVLNQINLNVSSGEFVALLGPSGCGKSTLLRLISSLEKPTAGKVIRSNVTESFVFQESTLLPWRTALKNVELPLELGKINQDERISRARNSLLAMGLGDAEMKYPAELSGGMKMRVSVARALVTEPSLLLLDEPFAALDESTRHSLQIDLRKRWLAKSPTVFFVTHSISEAVFLADRIIVFSARPGRVIADHEVELPSERTEDLRLSLDFLKQVQKVNEIISTQRTANV